jgi:hypothetical protein
MILPASHGVNHTLAEMGIARRVKATRRWYDPHGTRSRKTVRLGHRRAHQALNGGSAARVFRGVRRRGVMAGREKQDGDEQAGSH